MEAEKYTLARYASNPILQTIVVIHRFLFYDEKRTCVSYIHSTKLCYHWTITLCISSFQVRLNALKEEFEEKFLKIVSDHTLTNLKNVVPKSILFQAFLNTPTNV